MTARLERSAAVTIGADGVATIELAPSGAWSAWSVQRITVKLSTGGGFAATYRNNINEAALMDATSRGDADVADYIAPLQIPPGERLLIQWTGATPGARATATVSGSEVRL